MLGNLLYQKSIGRDNSVAIEIRMNHLSIFRFFPNGTNANNAEWLQAKANTVDMLQQSSLRFWAEMQISGKTQEEKRMPASGFACCGGGFPLSIRNVGVIGTIRVSGLPHTLRGPFSRNGSDYTINGEKKSSGLLISNPVISVVKLKRKSAFVVHTLVQPCATIEIQPARRTLCVVNNPMLRRRFI